MNGDNSRLLELRRRVQADPASIAFAPLAEECRRAGAHEEAVGICRAGLQSHPAHLAARVTLGRALFALGRLEDAEMELSSVLEKAADNFAANCALAEVLQQQGRRPEAATQFRRALDLARFDADLQHEIPRIEAMLVPPPVPALVPAPSPLDRVALNEEDGDALSVLERKLRENSEQAAREQRIIAELEDWLLAIAVDRSQHQGA